MMRAHKGGCIARHRGNPPKPRTGGRHGEEGAPMERRTLVAVCAGIVGLGAAGGLCLRARALRAFEAHYAQAGEFLRVRDYGAAADESRAALHDRPEEGGAWVLLAHSLLALGRLAEAEAAYLRAEQLDSALPGVGFGLATSARRRGDLAKAVELEERELARSPEATAVHVMYVDDCRASGQLGRATRWFTEAISASAGDPYAHYGLGLCRLEEGNTDAALAEFDSALKLRPDLMMARIGKAQVFWTLGNLDKVEAEAREALALEPHPGPHVILGSVRLREREPVEAEAEFREALRISHTDPAAHMFLGLVLWEQGRTDDALAELRQAARYGGDDYRTNCQLGTLLAREDDVHEGIVYLRRAAALKPRAATPHHELARALYGIGDYRGAWRELREAQRLGCPNTEELAARLRKKLPEQ
ncbi:MAG: tetratricopeptide repeat protein [Armatimonadetes bacterium]|nr:tetratricopeptide repeat protein [Armatimonadota bacterium]